MTVSTRKLHKAVIRMLKGILTAWDEWIEEQPEQTKQPDPGKDSPKR